MFPDVIAVLLEVMIPLAALRSSLFDIWVQVRGLDHRNLVPADSSRVHASKEFSRWP